MRMLSTFLYFLVGQGLATYAYSETCPPKRDLLPCTCGPQGNGDIFVRCNDPEITLKTLKKALNGLSGKKNVYLFLDAIFLGHMEDGADEVTMPSDFFSGVDGIKLLQLYHSRIINFSDDVRPNFLGLEDSLEVLVIFGSIENWEDSVPVKLQVGHLKRLRELQLIQNIINELSDDWFDGGPASLEYLTISDNMLEEVGSRAFANLVNLRGLCLKGNRFGAIKRSMFPNPAPSLRVLNLDDNEQTYIFEDLFSNMPSLHIVSFRANGIVTLDQGTWKPVWQQLDVIHLEGNPIKCDETRIKWVRSLRLFSSAFYGNCKYPKDMEGMALQDFIDNQNDPFIVTLPHMNESSVQLQMKNKTTSGVINY